MALAINYQLSFIAKCVFPAVSLPNRSIAAVRPTLTRDFTLVFYRWIPPEKFFPVFYPSGRETEARI
jgi:hypothetical protein